MLCKCCESEFVARKATMVFCSQRCQQTQWMRNKRGWEKPCPKQCVVCGREFTPDPYHPKAQTCSRKCSSRNEYRKHKDEYFARAIAYSRSNPEKHKSSIRKCHERKPEHYAAMWRVRNTRRRARIKGTFTVAEWKAICHRQRNLCWWCGTKCKLTIDHVVPVSRGGVNESHNIVGACAKCNSVKGSRMWPLSSGVLASRFLNSEKRGVTA